MKKPVIIGISVGAAVVVVVVVVVVVCVTLLKDDSKKSEVFFTKDITPENLIKLYQVLESNLNGKIGVKITSAEHDKQYQVSAEFMRPLVNLVNGTLVECNTAYDGVRNETASHRQVIEKHGYGTSNNFTYDLMDAEGDDLVLPVNGGKQIKENKVGKNFNNYDGFVVLSHFKGHLMAGYGGALKNVAIGMASREGKMIVHGAGDLTKVWDQEQAKFLEAMADAVKSIMDVRKDKMVFINVMANMSIDCDCDSNPSAPELGDIGMLASWDPVALDRACIDLVEKSEGTGKNSLLNRIKKQIGTHILDAAEDIGIGSKKYKLIDLDKK